MNPAANSSGEQKSEFGGRFATDAEDPENEGTAPADSVRAAISSLQEAYEYAAYTLTARVDSLRTHASHVFIYAGLAIVALVAAGAFVATAAVLICLGIADGLAILLWRMNWLGDLLTGVIVLAAAATTIAFTVKSIFKISREKLVKKYENRKRHQQAVFGRSVEDGAAGTAD